MAVEVTGTLHAVTARPKRGPMPEHHEVDIIVSFDDVGDQPVTLLAYELVLDDDVDTGIKVTAVMEGTRRLTVRCA